MKKLIVTIVLIFTLTSNLHASNAGAILELFLKGASKIITMIIFDDSDENNQTQEKKK